jgi:hypothetical protein
VKVKRTDQRKVGEPLKAARVPPLANGGQDGRVHRIVRGHLEAVADGVQVLEQLDGRAGLVRVDGLGHLELQRVHAVLGEHPLRGVQHLGLVALHVGPLIQKRRQRRAFTS